MAALGAWRDRTWLLLGSGFLIFATADSWYLLQLAAARTSPGPRSTGPASGRRRIAVAVAAGADAGAKREPADRGELVPVPGVFALLAVAVLSSAGAAASR